MVIAVYDESGTRTRSDVADYLTSTLQDPLARVPGVGDVNVFGSPYAMRIWLDPFKLSSFQLMPRDVIAAIEAQNTQVAAGQIGEQPALAGQMLNATVTARSRLNTHRSVPPPSSSRRKPTAPRCCCRTLLVWNSDPRAIPWQAGSI